MNFLKVDRYIKKSLLHKLFNNNNRTVMMMMIITLDFVTDSLWWLVSRPFQPTLYFQAKQLTFYFYFYHQTYRLMIVHKHRIIEILSLIIISFSGLVRLTSLRLLRWFPPAFCVMNTYIPLYSIGISHLQSWIVSKNLIFCIIGGLLKSTKLVSVARLDKNIHLSFLLE